MSAPICRTTQGLNYTWKAKVPTLNQVLRPWWGKLAVGMRYLLLRAGPLSMCMNQGGGFFRTDPSRDAAQHAALFPGVLDRASQRSASGRS